jgi:hypothetical protein
MSFLFSFSSRCSYRLALDTTRPSGRDTRHNVEVLKDKIAAGEKRMDSDDKDQKWSAHLMDQGSGDNTSNTRHIYQSAARRIADTEGE